MSQEGATYDITHDGPMGAVVCIVVEMGGIEPPCSEKYTHTSTRRRISWDFGRGE